MTVRAEDADLYSLVYASTAASSFDDEVFGSLLEQSRRDNGARGITGLLLYRNGRFIQFLEGPEAEVRSLLATIEKDPRHTGVRVLNDGHPQRRQFADWTMAYQPVRESGSPPPAGFRSTFDDLDNLDEPDGVLRAARELSLWFRVRSRDAP
ncbi:BLUF domain-containing protein [Microbacterium sp.]|uniref:BLUF domain-containing protein n=1 Tax=Microbacterium sp. TaxID=51671 RepID=UPI003F6EC054